MLERYAPGSGMRQPTPAPRNAAAGRGAVALAFVCLSGGASLGPVAPAPLFAQDAPHEAADPSWNSPEVLELVERGREARRALVRDGDLESYRALTEGHIYFFVDPEEGERALIRVDQVAVELHWTAPDQVRQHIVGERSETRLPVREFRYYLDRLTLVQYGFGDEIEVGSGMDVAGVPHPLATGSAGEAGPSPYDFRRGEALTLTLPGRAEPVRLQEIEVRPRRPEEPGIVGTIVLDRATASIVRMAFTFTPASYVDPRTDRISVELDYGLWEERYWLPNRQRIEVRRELPELDLGVGTIIRAVLRVGGYELNPPPGELLALRRAGVSAAPREVREAYPFSEGLYDGLARHGLDDVLLEVDPRELRRRATELVREQQMSGLMPVRFHLPRISDLVRFSRAEGVSVGMGLTTRRAGDVRIRTHGAVALGDVRARGRGSVRVDGPLQGAGRWRGAIEANHAHDLGLAPGADPLLSSLGGLFRGEDYRDPYRVSAARFGVERPLGGDHVVELGVGVERHRSMDLAHASAPLDGARAFRDVRPVEEGTFFQLASRLERPAVAWPGGARGSAALSGEFLSGSACPAAVPGQDGSSGPAACPRRTGAAFQAEAEARWGPPAGTRETRLDVQARSWAGDDLLQGHRLLGGRGSLPGYPFRSFAGRHLAHASLTQALDLRAPHVRLRAGLHAGWAGGLTDEAAAAWGVAETGNVRTAGTLGLGLFWDLLRMEVARGFDGGEWQLLIHLDPRWWGLL